jgi:tetratricopeptide (TPR) repeat protein
LQGGYAVDTVGNYDIGQAIRRVRKERNLRLEDLADENISVATISNIERGVSHVKFDKVDYLLKKLNIGIENLPEILMNEQREMREIKFELNRAEYVWRLGQYEKALQRVNDLQLSDKHPLAPLGYYIKGKALLYLKKYVKAERALYTAINLCNQKGYDKSDNIEAASFLEIGMCCYFQNDIQKALEFTESGLDAFIEDGDRGYLKHVLLTNQLVFLEIMGRITEGLNRIQSIWEIVNEIQDHRILLLMYWLRAELLRRSNLNEQAIPFAEKGLDLAIRNKNYDKVIQFWTMLGCIYTVKAQWKKAEACFRSGLDAEQLVCNPKAKTRAYIWLGKLCYEQERWNEAKEMLQRAINNASETEDVPELIQAYMVMGDSLKREDNKQLAIEQYKLALDLAQKHGLSKKELKLLLRLAQCVEKEDEQEFVHCMRNMYRIQSELQVGEAEQFDELE